MPIDEPLTWQISKIENTIPRGIQYVTLYQDKFNQHTDKVWYPKDEGNPLPGQYTMLADYYEVPDRPITDDSKPISDTTLKLSCGSTHIYVGASKIVTATCMNGDEDVSTNMSYTWSYEIDGADASALIKETAVEKSNKIKITFVGDEEYSFKELIIKCEATDGDGNTLTDNLRIGIMV